MNWLVFLQSRLELSLTIIDFMLTNQKFADEFISPQNKEKIQQDISKILNTNYQDPELYELSNKLEIIGMYEFFLLQKKMMEEYDEDTIIDKIHELDLVISSQQYFISEQLSKISERNLSVIEIVFRNLKKDFQQVRFNKELKKELVKSLFKFNSAKSKLAIILNNFY